MSKILFLTPELPYPPVSGGKLKSWKLLEFLTQNYQVSVGTILKGDDKFHLEEFQTRVAMQNLYFDAVERDRSLSNLVKSYLKGMPLNPYRTYSKRFSVQIREDIHKYDMVIADHYEVFQYIPRSYKGKVVLHEHNAYYLMWQRYAETPENSLGRRLVSKLESMRVKRYERTACQLSNLVFASPNDIDSLEAIGVDRSRCAYTYHLGDDAQLELPEIRFENTDKSLLYVGSLGWEANIHGLLWFIKKVWPELKKTSPDLMFTIVGKKPDQRLLDAASQYKNIHFTGFVEDLEPLYKKHRVFVAPLFFGAGMKVKVLNAMSRGIPVVTTHVGSEGMEYTNMEHLMVRKSVNGMATAINMLLSNQKAWQVLAKSSRTLIKEKYTWKALFADMQSELDRCLLGDKPLTKSEKGLNDCDLIENKQTVSIT